MLIAVLPTVFLLGFDPLVSTGYLFLEVARG